MAERIPKGITADHCRRIRNLFRLIGSPNANEAANARAKLTALLADHGLSWNDITAVVAAADADDAAQQPQQRKPAATPPQQTTDPQVNILDLVLAALRKRVRLRTRIRDFANQLRRDKLTKLCNKYGTDKGDTVAGCHGYAAIYHSFFKDLRDKEMSVCEIGLCRTSTTKVPSLTVWRNYFSRAKLFGFDIDDFSTVKIPNCTIVRGDSSSREDLRKLGDLGPFDIVIEDASHASHHQQITLAALFPFVKSGGLFCIEDLHYQPEDLEPKDAPKTRDVIRNGYQSPYIQDSEAAFLRANVKSVRFFDSNDKRNEDSHDALVIIERG